MSTTQPRHATAILDNPRIVWIVRHDGAVHVHSVRGTTAALVTAITARATTMRVDPI